MTSRLRSTVLSALVLFLFTVSAVSQAAAPKTLKNGKTYTRAELVAGIQEDDMSPMGRLAHMVVTGRLDQMLAEARGGERDGKRGLTALGGPPPSPGKGDGPAGGQAETTIAVDSTGLHVVIGFNDTRGFSTNPVSVSGWAYSDDGGATFTDGGPLPITVPTTTIGATVYPQAFGDPDIKYLGGSTFIYASIVVGTVTNTALAVRPCQALGIHRSVDNGHTWTGPYIITAALNPRGLFTNATATGNPVDSADKEFIDVDPDTGRVLVSWTNFGPAVPEIRTAYSDNVLAGAPPTWSAGVVVNVGDTFSESGSMPRFAGNGSSNAYVVYNQRNSFTGTSGGWPFQNETFARSTDNGATWSAPIKLRATDFYPIDYVLGNDRVHQFPGMAVDTTAGTYSGRVYVAYVDNTNLDGGDIAFQRSTDGGVTFSPHILLNARPGSDRTQWFPYVAVDKNTGRVSVTWYDQGSATSGDLTQSMWIYSDDGGTTWSKPTSLTDRPFHAGYGNDTGQPNLGDYNGVVAQNGTAWAVWAGTPSLVLYPDGQPSTSFTVPDALVKAVTTARAALDLQGPTFTDTTGNNNGSIDAGEQIHFKLPLRNFVTNPVSGLTTYTGVSATLTTSAPNVTVLSGTQTYASIAPGATNTNAVDFVVQFGAAFVAGTKVDFTLAVTTGQGTVTLGFLQDTGTPVPTTIFSENFNASTAPALPAGWAASHGGGANTVPWVTNNTFPSTNGTNGLFHINANDGVGGTGNPTRFERAFSPLITVPAGAQDVLLEFDVVTNMEDAADFNILAYDGFTLRITDQTAGRTLRSVLAEAFAEQFTTGTSLHFPKHAPRNSSTSYFEDMSIWSGDSAGIKHVRMLLPGMAGSTVQLRFEFMQDSGGICTDVRPAATACGVWVDNIVMQSLTYVSAPVQADLRVTAAAIPATVTSGSNVTYTYTVTNLGTDAAVNTVFTDTLPATLTYVSATSALGGTVNYSAGVVTVSYASLANAAVDTITIVAATSCTLANGATVTNGASVASSVTLDPVPANNSVSQSFGASNPAPVFVPAPADQIAFATGPAGTTVTYVTPTTTDNCGATVVTTCLPASGTVFPIGLTTVSCTAVDAGGATAGATFTVDVRYLAGAAPVPTLSFLGMAALGLLLAAAGWSLLKHLGGGAS